MHMGRWMIGRATKEVSGVEIHKETTAVLSGSRERSQESIEVLQCLVG